MKHRQSTAQLGALFPFAAAANLGQAGAYIGPDLLGRPFYFDPMGLYGRPDLSLNDPNILVLGQIGKGKSALVKCLARRLHVFGYSTVYLDPKGETGALADAFGVRPLRPAPGGELRLNPCDADLAGDEGGGLFLPVLMAVLLERPLTIVERHLMTEACLVLGRSPSSVTLATLLDRLRASGEDSRELSLALSSFLLGPGRRLFDGETSRWVDLDAPLIALDLSVLLQTLVGGQLTTAIMALAAAWLFGVIQSRPRRRLFVADEAWFLLRDPATAQWLQQQWKLARSLAVANVAVLHRLSDLETAAGGIEIARGLLADTQTRVIFAQPPAELALLQRWLGLSEEEAHIVLRLPRGWALWKVAQRAFVVQLHIQESEREVVDTDQALRKDLSRDAAKGPGGTAAHRFLQSATAARPKALSNRRLRVLLGGQPAGLNDRPRPPHGAA